MNILLPTDFSKNSLNAIFFAMQLFENQECVFYILHVQKTDLFVSENSTFSSSSVTLFNTISHTANKSIENIISKLKTTYGNKHHSFQALVEYGALTQAINHLGKSLHIDLILMGRKGASGFQKTVFGSNTTHVIAEADVPVLAIPEQYLAAKEIVSDGIVKP